MPWRVLLRWRTWMSAWYLRTASATTNVSTRQALSDVSASLDTCCRRTLSLVHKVKWRPPILFCHTVLADISSDAITQESDSLCHLLFGIWFMVCIPVRKTPFVVICLHIHGVLFSWSLWVPSCLQALILPNNSYSNHTLTSLSWTDSNAKLITSLLSSKRFFSWRKKRFHYLKIVLCTNWRPAQVYSLEVFCVWRFGSVPDFNQQWLSPTQACLNRILMLEHSANYSEG